MLFDEAHLADDTTGPNVFIDDAAAADLQRTTLDDIHAGWRIALGKENLAAFQDNMRVIDHQRDEVRIPRLMNDPVFGRVGPPPARCNDLVSLTVVTIHNHREPLSAHASELN